MNEIQVIQQQLATERAHFSEVAAACARESGDTTGSDWISASSDYFAFALTRFEPAAAESLALTLARGLDADFVRAFTEAARVHFEKLDALLRRNAPVTEWRAVSRIDADSIFAERTR